MTNADSYQSWRERKLARYPRGIDELMVTLPDSHASAPAELDAVHQALQRTNFALYRLVGSGDKASLVRLGEQFGLTRLDGNLCSDDDSVSSIRVVGKRRAGEYIPYTDKPLNWHTDGYYNRMDRQIRGVILHCAQPAAEGGESLLLDHEIAYIHLRDRNPEYIRALMAPDAMIIPPNVQNGEEIRPQQGGPVFSLDANGFLHMRYSARGRNIVWKQDSATLQAAKCLLDLFHSDSPYIFRHRLKAGEGVITNNVLHARTAFRNSAGQERLLYRARYFDRVTGTENRDYAES